MARLPQGVRKRKDGTFEKRFTIEGRRYSVYASNTKELAEKEQETRGQINQGLYKKNSNITLDDYFSKWVERKMIDTKGNSLNTYISIYKNHISEKLGKYKIKDIERRQIIEIQSESAKHSSVTTCNYIMAVLKIVLNDAIRDQVITNNPAANIKNLKKIKAEKKANESYHRALTEAEQTLFMQACKTSYYYEFFALALCTGMRFGELCALTWNDIDYLNNVIHVTKTQTHDINSKITIGTTKTEAGKRDIPLTPNARQALKAQREKIGIIYRFEKESNPVFISPNGKTIFNRSVNSEIERVLNLLRKQGYKIEHFTMHALRDTFATRYIEQGGNLQTLQKILGHSSIKMTADIYAHVLPNTIQNEMQKIVINI